MVIGRIALAVLTALAATGCVPRDVPSSPGTGPETTATVTRVLDGDTIEVAYSDGDVRVRLAGLNAPETGECFGDVATDELEESLDGETVVLETTGVDQFDRVLAYVSVGDVDVNLDLVRRGLAIATTAGDDFRRPALLDAEEHAYSDAIGLWAPNVCGIAEDSLVAIDSRASQVDPAGRDENLLDEEYIVIVNNGGETVSLAHWTVRDESSVHRLVFGPEVSLGPGSTLVITSDDARWDPGHGPIWNNAGDMALLQDRNGNVVSRWRY